MSYITEIFERLDLQQIREFLLHGVGCFEISRETYKRRLESAGKPAFKMIDEKFPNEEERDKIAGDVCNYASVTQDVYMEIGMRCGAVLAMQLLTNPQNE